MPSCIVYRPMVRRALSALLLVFAAYAAEQRFVYLLPADSAVSLQANLVYKTTSATNLHFDLYRPANQAAALPVVVFMQGVGSGNMREWTQYKGWGRLVTTAGMAGIVYDSHDGGVAEDATDLLAYI